MLKALLVRRDFLVHLKGIFPRMETKLKEFDSETWYMLRFGIDRNGNNLKPGKDASDDEQQAQEQIEEPVASNYTCLKPLTILCDSRFALLETLKPSRPATPSETYSDSGKANAQHLRGCPLPPLHGRNSGEVTKLGCSGCLNEQIVPTCI